MNGSVPASAGRMALLTIVVVVAVLKLAQEVFVPLALAILLTFLLAPLVERLVRWHIPRGVAVIASMVVACGAIGVLGDVVFNQLSDLTHELPAYQRQLRTNLTHLGGVLRGGVAETTKAVEQFGREIDRVSPATDPKTRSVPKVQVVEPPPTAIETLRNVVGPALKPVGTGFAIIVLVAFMLLKLPDLRDRIMRLLGSRNLHITTEALGDAASRVSRYLVVQILINGWTGLWVAVGLWFLHVPNALLWGALTLCLRFIPYIGVWAAAAIPVALSFAVFDDWTRPLMVFGLFALIEFISFSLLEPWLYGTHTGVSPVALLLAAGFWAWLWGFVGLLLAIPMTVCAVVMGKYIPQLGFLQVLLGDEPVLEPHERLYQRLLSSNRDEADSVLQAALREQSILEVCDAIIVPAMLLAKEDHNRGSLPDERLETILEHVNQWVEERLDALDPERARSTDPVVPVKPAVILCVPAFDRADEIIAKLLEAVLRERDLSVRIAGARDANELAAKGAPLQAVVISALPPEAVTPARAVTKRIRSSDTGVAVLVGLWKAEGDLERPRQRLTAAGATRLVTTFSECFSALQSVLGSAELLGPDRPSATDRPRDSGTATATPADELVAPGA